MREPHVTLTMYLTPAGYQADLDVRGTKVRGACRDFHSDQDVDEMITDLVERLEWAIERFRKERGRPRSRILDDDLTNRRNLEWAFRRVNIERNRRYVKRIRERTVCEKCKCQPIDWHREEHVQNPTWRLSKLPSTGCSLKRIKEEIAACQALCRRCHMQEDGRMEPFIRQARTRDRTKPTQSCLECGRLFKPMRRGLCGSCYNRWLKTTPITDPCQKCARAYRPLRRGMCPGCYDKWLSTTPITKSCAECGKPSKRLSRDKCKTCYERWRRIAY